MRRRYWWVWHFNFLFSLCQINVTSYVLPLKRHHVYDNSFVHYHTILVKYTYVLQHLSSPCIRHINLRGACFYFANFSNPNKWSYNVCWLQFINFLIVLMVQAAQQWQQQQHGTSPFLHAYTQWQNISRKHATAP